MHFSGVGVSSLKAHTVTTTMCYSGRIYGNEEKRGTRRVRDGTRGLGEEVMHAGLRGGYIITVKSGIWCRGVHIHGNIAVRGGLDEGDPHQKVAQPHVGPKCRLKKKIPRYLG